MTLRRIHTLHRPAVGQTLFFATDLFVHGGYTTARCWDEYFLPYLGVVSRNPRKL